MKELTGCMTDRNRELEPGKRKSADHWTVRNDGVLNIRASAEERSCLEGV